MSTGDDGLSPIPILHLDVSGVSAEIRFGPLRPDGAMTVGVGVDRLTVKMTPIEDERFLAAIGPRREIVRVYQKDRAIFVHDACGIHAFTAIPYLTYISAAAETTGELRAPMMGTILKVNVAVGDRVKGGDVAAVLESMKMELRINCQTEGVVTAVNCRAGDTVERNAVVAVVEPDRPP